jgi:hypothetical protein
MQVGLVGDFRQPGCCSGAPFRVIVCVTICPKPGRWLMQSSLPTSSPGISPTLPITRVSSRSPSV